MRNFSSGFVLMVVLFKRSERKRQLAKVCKGFCSKLFTKNMKINNVVPLLRKKLCWFLCEVSVNLKHDKITESA